MKDCIGCDFYESNENGYPCDHCKRLIADVDDDFYKVSDIQFNILVKYGDCSMSKGVVKVDGIIARCKICDKKSSVNNAVRHFNLRGYGVYICDSCRVPIAVLSDMAK